MMIEHQKAEILAWEFNPNPNLNMKISLMLMSSQVDGLPPVWLPGGVGAEEVVGEGAADGQGGLTVPGGAP